MVSQPSLKCGERFILGFRGPTIPSWLKDFANRFSLGGVILFDYNVQTKTYENNIYDQAQLSQLCAEIHALPGRPLIFIDQEGGKVRRLKESKGFAPLPSAYQMGNIPLAKTPELQALMDVSFRQMKTLGIDVNLGPVVDLNLNPENPDLGKVERCFSDSPMVVENLAKLWRDSAKASGLGLCLKHFPGMGGATVNSHEELTDITGKVPANQVDLFFRLSKDFSAAGLVPLILVGHGIMNDSAVLPATHGRPATTSTEIIEYLRMNAAPGAVLISDDLQMQGLQRAFPDGRAVLECLKAGLDFVIIGNNMMPEDDACLEYAQTFATLLQAESKYYGKNHTDALIRIHNLKRFSSRNSKQMVPA